jgi:hypothetical protein
VPRTMPSACCRQWTPHGQVQVRLVAAA